MYRRILLPTDFGPLTSEALTVARSLAADDAKIRLLNIIDEQALLPFPGLSLPSDFESRAAESLAALAREGEGATWSIQTEIRMGRIHSEILTTAKTWDADLIVIGSHGRKGVRKFFLGSVADRITRASPIPVCVVKAAEEHPKQLRRIAIASDLGNSDKAASEHFEQLAKETEAEAWLIHAFDDNFWLGAWMLPVYTSGNPLPTSVAVPKETQKTLESSRVLREKAIKEFAASYAEHGIEVKTQLLSGDPPEAVCEFATEHDIDLLVAGTHGYGSLDRFLLGSTADKILRLSECPVLIVPTSHGKAEEKKPEE